MAGTKSLFFVGPTDGNELDLLAAQLDLKFIAGLEVEHGGVGLAHQQVAVELNFCGVAQLAATLARTPADTVGAKAYTLGTEQGLVKRRKIEALTTVFLRAHVATATDQIGFGNITQLFDLGEQFGACKHVR